MQEEREMDRKRERSVVSVSDLLRFAERRVAAALSEDETVPSDEELTLLLRSLQKREEQRHKEEDMKDDSDVGHRGQSHQRIDVFVSQMSVRDEGRRMRAIEAERDLEMLKRMIKMMQTEQEQEEENQESRKGSKKRTIIGAAAATATAAAALIWRFGTPAVPNAVADVGAHAANIAATCMSKMMQ